MKFEVLVLTHNEEQQIASCLGSLSSAERIVVLDSGSTDRTLEIASSFDRVEIRKQPFVSFAEQRNHGLQQAFRSGTWVLHLDADERVTPELAAELRALEPPATVVAYNIASRTYLRAQPVFRASGFPTYQTRLTLVGSFRFEQVGHGQKAPAALGSLPRLRHAYEHHPFEKGEEAWRERHRRYARDEARALVEGHPGAAPAGELRDPIRRRQWLNRVSARLAFRPSLVWLYLMFVRGGIWDGPAGWEYCRLRKEYEDMVTKRVAGARRHP